MSEQGVKKFSEELLNNPTLRNEFRVAVAQLAARYGQAVTLQDVDLLIMALAQSPVLKNIPDSPAAPGGDHSVTCAVGEEDGARARLSTMAVGEEDRKKPPYNATTQAVGEEDRPQPSTEAVGEEDGPRPSTLALGEEDKKPRGPNAPQP